MTGLPLNLSKAQFTEIIPGLYSIKSEEDLYENGEKIGKVSITVPRVYIDDNGQFVAMFTHREQRHKLRKKG